VAITGVRLGELRSLQWKHVDFQLRSLLIVQSLYRGQLVPPKTEGSVRRILLGPALTNILKAHYQSSLHQTAEDFVFCKSNGSPLHPDVVREDVLHPIIDRLGIERRTRESGFHRFRHCAGSIINDETGNHKLAQSLLGHSKLSTTADIYTHSMTDAERKASEALEKVILGDLFPVCSQFCSQIKTGSQERPCHEHPGGPMAQGKSDNKVR
jgi:integrase